MQIHNELKKDPDILILLVWSQWNNPWYQYIVQWCTNKKKCTIENRNVLITLTHVYTNHVSCSYLFMCLFLSLDCELFWSKDSNLFILSSPLPGKISSCRNFINNHCIKEFLKYLLIIITGFQAEREGKSNPGKIMVFRFIGSITCMLTSAICRH